MGDIRLFVLGALTQGPMHGHQIRRHAEVDRTELWTDVKTGSLYGALNRLLSEGAIEVVRTEQSGGPARTVYALTDAGRAEFASHRDEALRAVRLRPDPVDLALQHTADLDEDELRAIISDRRDSLASTLSAWQQLQERATPFLHGLEPMTFAHATIRLRAEIEWHDQLLEKLTTLHADREQSTSEGQQ